MKRYSTALLFASLTLTSQLAHADVIDDAIGNIQQAINDAYNPNSSRSNNDDDDERYDRSRQTDSRQYDERRRQLDDRRRRLDERQRQLDEDRRQLEDDERRLEDDYDRG
ncbi:DDRRRQL repeat protein YjdP [Enterobacter sp. 186315]